MAADASKMTVDLLQKKQAIRNQLRQEYWKKITQPPSKNAPSGDYVFDPAHQRYFSMQSTRFNFFRPTHWNLVMFISAFVLPFTGICYMFKTDRTTREASYRRGEVAYKDRNFKLV